MDPSVIESHCAHCGAPVTAGTTTCPSCGQPARDPNAQAITDAATSGGAALHAAISASGTGTLATAGALLLLLSHPDQDVRAAAAAGLESTEDPTVLREMLVLIATRRWLGQSVQGNFTETDHGPSSLTAVIRKTFSRADGPRLQVLRTALHDTDRHLREAAADLLQYAKDPSVRDDLVQAVKSDTDPIVRARAAYALGQLCDASTVEVLVAALHDNSPLVQSKAAQALSRLGSEAIAPTVQSLSTGSPEVALHSARLLGEIGSPAAVGALIDTLQVRQGLARLYAEQALVQMGPDILPPLLETLIRHNDSAGLREAVAYVLRRMKLPERERKIVRPVIESTDRIDAALETPAAAYQALGQIQGVTVAELRARLQRL